MTESLAKHNRCVDFHRMHLLLGISVTFEPGDSHQDLTDEQITHTIAPLQEENPCQCECGGEGGGE